MRNVFRASDHTYWSNDRRLLSATEMLRMVGYIDTAWYTSEACERGSFVHQAIALDMARDLDWSTLDAGLAGYVRQAAWFLTAYEIEPIAVETPRYDEVLGIAGTPDVIGYWRNQRGQRRPVVIDWKTGDPQAWHALQLAIYRHLITPVLPMADRVAVYLSPDAFAVREHTDPREWAKAAAVITIATDQHAARRAA